MRLVWEMTRLLVGAHAVYGYGCVKVMANEDGTGKRNASKERSGGMAPAWAWNLSVVFV